MGIEPTTFGVLVGSIPAVLGRSFHFVPEALQIIFCLSNVVSGVGEGAAPPRIKEGETRPLQHCSKEKRHSCSELMKTALKDVLLPTLLNVVNNIVRIVTPDCGLIQAQQC